MTTSATTNIFFSFHRPGSAKLPFAVHATTAAAVHAAKAAIHCTAAAAGIHAEAAGIHAATIHAAALYADGSTAASSTAFCCCLSSISGTYYSRIFRFFWGTDHQGNRPWKGPIVTGTKGPGGVVTFKILAKDQTIHYDVFPKYIKLIFYKIQCRTIYP
jgi:hypothetical protein